MIGADWLDRVRFREMESAAKGWGAESVVPPRIRPSHPHPFAAFGLAPTLEANNELTFPCKTFFKDFRISSKITCVSRVDSSFVAA